MRIKGLLSMCVVATWALSAAPASAHMRPALITTFTHATQINKTDGALVREIGGVHLYTGAKSRRHTNSTPALATPTPSMVQIEVKKQNAWRSIRSLRTQGFYSGNKPTTRRFTQGFFSGG